MAAPTNPLTLNSYVQALADLAVVQVLEVGGIVQGVDEWFQTLIPNVLNYAEDRIARDLDLNQALTSNSYSLTADNNVLTIPVEDFVAVQTVSLNTGSAVIPLTPVSKEWLMNVYSNPSFTGVPHFFAPMGGDAASAGNTSTNFMVGPYPDTAYPVSLMGVIRQPSLYKNVGDPVLASTQTTFISTWLPELLLMASMIQISAYQRNFSATSNDPQMPGSYENMYQTLLMGALTEEARKRFAASAWSANSNPTVASPGR